MPNRPPDQEAPAFGERLCALLADKGIPRRGAGAYLQRKYKVSNVTANDWLNGKFRPEIPTARQIADDHGTTFNRLYFGDEEGSPGTAHRVHLDPTIVRSIAETLDDRYKLEGGFELAQRPEEFVRAYELWTGMADANDPNTLRLVISHADLSPQGLDRHAGTGKAASPVDAPGTRVRTGGRRR